MSDVVIAGAGGFGKELLGYARGAGFNVVAFLDTTKTGTLLGVPIEHPDNWTGTRDALMGVGTPQSKQLVLDEFKGFRWQTMIHPSAHVSPDAIVEKGSIVCPYAIVAGNAVVGNYAHLNVHTYVSHDCVVGSYSTLFPSVTLNGGTRLKNMVLMCTQSFTSAEVTIGQNSTVFPGVNVFQDVPRNGKAR